jgi:hypothetical protein
MIMAICGVLVGIRRLFTALWPRNLAEWTIAVGAAAGSIFALVWVMTSKVNSPGQLEAVERSNFWDLLPTAMLQWVFQAIGAFPFRDEPAPTVVYAIGLLVLITFSVIAVRAAVRNNRLTAAIALTVIGSFAAPALLTWATFAELGLSWQGRYGMTFTAGLFLLFGLALDRGEFPVRRAPVVVAVCGWVAMQVVSQASVLDQQREDHYLIEVTGWWNPSVLVLIVLGSIAAWTWLRSWEPRLDDPEPSRAMQGAGVRD